MLHGVLPSKRSKKPPDVPTQRPLEVLHTKEYGLLKWAFSRHVKRLFAPFGWKDTLMERLPESVQEELCGRNDYKEQNP